MTTGVTAIEPAETSIDTALRPYYTPFPGGLPTDTETGRVDVEAFVEPHLEKLAEVSLDWANRRSDATGVLDVLLASDLPDTTEYADRIISLPSSDEHHIYVVGDLHGCYTNYLAFLHQERIVERLAAGENLYVVFLGDFFDRGRRTLDGIMPSLLRLHLAWPDNVVFIRGNHETFAYAMPGDPRGIVASVRPSDTIDFWRDYIDPFPFFARYLDFFLEMPVCAVLRNGYVITHAGPPCPAFVNRMENLGGILHGPHDAEEEFNLLHILWTDPDNRRDRFSAKNASDLIHGPFGRIQAEEFLDKVGARALVRGHEGLDEGFRSNFDDRVITIFSAGGQDNPDSNVGPWAHYENVTPRYLHILGDRKEAVRIRWERYEDEARKGPA